MSYNYLSLVNALAAKLNEVPLDLSTFSDADGVYTDFKNAINSAILDICQEEDNEWPFNWVETSFNTTIGQAAYNKPATAINIDWDSFRIERPSLAVYTATQAAGVATITILAGHQLKTGDNVTISGAAQEAYNGLKQVTVVSDTVFTFSISPDTTSPATGTIVAYPPYQSKELKWITLDTYRNDGIQAQDNNVTTEGFGMPEIVVRKPNNNFILSRKPDRIYTCKYEYYTMPTDLVNYNDVPIIPEAFKQVIIDGALIHGYFFRDNIEQTDRVDNRYRDGVNRMRRILINQPHYMRVGN